MLVGEAFQNAMNNRGVPIVKINYEDLGNWAYSPEHKARGEKPHFHIHIFGRILDLLSETDKHSSVNWL